MRISEKLRLPSDNVIGRLTTALFLLAVLALNIVVFVFANAFSWFFYADTRYEHTVSDATDSLLAKIEHPVTVSFCSAEEDLAASATSSLVYETAKQYAARHEGLISVGGYYNVYTDYAKMKEYSEKTGAVVTKDTVIVESDIECYALTMSNFFLLDQSGTIRAYNGEEAFASAFLRVQTEKEKLPVAYFTVDHGETFAVESLLSQIFYAGYDVGITELNTVKLSDEEVPSNAALLVISNPIYDFETSNGGVATEIDRLAAYIEGGGKVYITLDAGHANYAGLHNLRALLKEYGFTTEETPVVDFRNGVPGEERIFSVSFAKDGVGKAVGERIARYSDRSVLVRDTAPITLSENQKGMTVSPLLVTADSATHKDKNGAFIAAAYASGENGAGIVLSTSGYINFDDAVNTEKYANEDFLYESLSLLGASTPLSGCTMLTLEDQGLNDLTNAEANTFSIITVAVLPVTLLLFGIGLTLYRRRR